MSELCPRCNALEPSEKAKEAMTDLTERISGLFVVQEPDLVTRHGPDGIVVQDFGLGVEQVENNEEAAVVFLVGTIWEGFQKTFGETPTSRKLWWRERPNFLGAQNFYTRRTQRLVFFRLAAEGLTQDELSGLCHRSEEAVARGAAIEFTLIGEKR